MLGKWLNRPKDSGPGFKHLENSATLDETYKIAREADNPYFDEAVSRKIVEQYKISDRESFDCHSFMASIAKRELAADTVIAPPFEVPDRDKFEYETEWQHEFQNTLEKLFKTPEWQPYIKSQREITTNIYNNSEHIPIPFIQPTDEASAKRRGEIVRYITGDVIREITRKGSSRVLLFSANEDEHFRDVHSSVILGLTKDGKDALVLEKLAIGEPVRVRKLSDVIDLQTLQYSENQVLNILRKPISRMTSS